MTFAAFRRCMAERRQHPRDTIEWRYLTRAARKCLWIARGQTHNLTALEAQFSEN